MTKPLPPIPFLETAIACKERMQNVRRRTIVTALLGMVLIILLGVIIFRPRQPQFIFAPYPQIYASPPAMPTVQRAPPDSDDVRTSIISVGTRVNDIACAHWVSATLAGVPVTTAGFGQAKYTNLDKLPLINRTLGLQNMRDWDVVIVLDQDTVFTGTDLQPFIDEFVRRSPAHPDDLNVREVRRGTMAAPLRFASDPGCWAPRATDTIARCVQQFNDIEVAMNNVSGLYDFEYLWEANISFMNARTPELYLNSGFYMARVWAFRELLAAQPLFTQELPYHNAPHWCDQSIYTGLYLDLRWGEINQGLLAPTAHKSNKARVNQFGLHYGLIDTWRVKPPAMLILGHGIPTVRIDAGLYGLPYTTSIFSQVVDPAVAARMVSGILHEVPSVESYVRDAALRYANTEGIRTVRSAPSLFGITPRLVDQSSHGDFPTLRPAVLHFADAYKYERFQMYLPFFGWYIAMDLEPNQRKRTVEILRLTNIPVMNGPRNELTTINLDTHCGVWITKNMVNGTTVY